MGPPSSYESKYAASISKAINQLECPVKEKHVRNTIIGTFQERGAATFWSCALRLPLEDNRTVAWKFCYVLHKIMRDGHPHVIAHSQCHRSAVEHLASLWGLLEEGDCQVTHLYCRLLLAKLDFHNSYPRFPGNLHVTTDELHSITENNIRVYYEMLVKMCDYIDGILRLQSAIIESLFRSTWNSKSNFGLHRFALLLVPCIEDASELYVCCVPIIYMLQTNLPPEYLTGLLVRFLKQREELREFFLTASSLEYLCSLTQIPELPETPPPFIMWPDFRRTNYVNISFAHQPWRI